MLRPVLQATAKAAGLVTATSAGYVTYLYQTDEGTRRAITAYSAFVPVVLHYRWVEAQQKWFSTTEKEAAATWKALDDRYAFPVVQTLADLQGMYCKYGQTAAGFTNTFGDAWIKEFRKLEDQVPPRSVEIVRQTIAEETGKPVNETFAEVDPIPLGSASIGQVHRARLVRTNQDVCVKVQYPESSRLFRNDMTTIRTFCRLFAPEHVVTLNALEQQNALELDYRNEAQNLKQVSLNMKHHGFVPQEVVVPEPIEELSTQRMLVMQFLPGPKLIEGVHAFYEEWAHLNGTTLEDMEREARERILLEGIPAKYSGPGAFRVATYRRYLAVRDWLLNRGIDLYNYSLGWAMRHSLCYQKSSLPPNTPRIIDTLMRVHGYQLFADGIFNADPHGGNFLLLPDGRIGLIDYGSTKRFTRNERLAACLLYVALKRRDEQMLFDMCKVGGYKSKYGKKDVLLKLLEFGYDSWGQDVTGGKNLQQFIDELKTEDPWEEVPDNFVMAQFMSVRLRSLALGMNHPVRCSDWWAPIAEQVLQEEGLPYESWDYQQLLEYKPEVNIQRHKFA